MNFYVNGSWTEQATPLTDWLTLEIPGPKDLFSGLDLKSLSPTLLLEFFPNRPELAKSECEAIERLLKKNRLEKRAETHLKVTGQNTLVGKGIVLHTLSHPCLHWILQAVVDSIYFGNRPIIVLSKNDIPLLHAAVKLLETIDPKRVLLSRCAFVSNGLAHWPAISDRVDTVISWGATGSANLAPKDVFDVENLHSEAIVTKQGAEESGMDALARSLAESLALFDQRSENAPTVIWTEGKKLAMSLMEHIASHFDGLENEVLSQTDALRIAELRGRFEVAELKGAAKIATSKSPGGFTLIYTKEIEKDLPETRHRVLCITTFKEDEVAKSVKARRQSIARIHLMTGAFETDKWKTSIAEAGLSVSTGTESLFSQDATLPLEAITISAQQQLGRPVRFTPIEKDAYLTRKVVQLVERARGVPFYQDRLDKVAVSSLADLSKIRPLTRSEYELNTPPRGYSLLDSTIQSGYVFRNGGDHDHHYSIWSKEDWTSLVESGAHILKQLGLTEMDRVANCLFSGDLYHGFVYWDQINTKLGVQSFPFAGSLSPERFLEVWRRFRINVIQAVPSVLVPLLRVTKQLEPRFSLEKIFYSGGLITNADRLWIEENISPKTIGSVVLQPEVGHFAYQSGNGLFRLTPSHNLVEIVDVSGAPVAPGNAGRILVTCLSRLDFPLIRYEVGDRGRLVEVEESGEKILYLDYLGRETDLLYVGSTEIRYQEFVSALAAEPISALQLAAKTDAGGEYLIVRIESQTQGPAIKKRFESALLTQIADLSQRLKDRSLTRLELEVYAPGFLPRSERSGKIRPLVDERV